MQDIVEPQVAERIDRFMHRKSREFPELRLPKKWYEYEFTPGRHRLGKTKKHSQRFVGGS